MSVTVGYCGVCCSHCGMRLRIPNIAEELKRFVQSYRYSEWIQHITQDFEFSNFMKGLVGLLIQVARVAFKMAECLIAKSGSAVRERA